MIEKFGENNLGNFSEKNIGSIEDIRKTYDILVDEYSRAENINEIKNIKNKFDNYHEKLLKIFEESTDKDSGDYLEFQNILYTLEKRIIPEINQLILDSESEQNLDIKSVQEKDNKINKEKTDTQPIADKINNFINEYTKQSTEFIANFDINNAKKYLIESKSIMKELDEVILKLKSKYQQRELNGLNNIKSELQEIIDEIEVMIDQNIKKEIEEGNSEDVFEKIPKEIMEKVTKKLGRKNLVSKKDDILLKIVDPIEIKKESDKYFVAVYTSNKTNTDFEDDAKFIDLDDIGFVKGENPVFDYDIYFETNRKRFSKNNKDTKPIKNSNEEISQEILEQVEKFRGKRNLCIGSNGTPFKIVEPINIIKEGEYYKVAFYGVNDDHTDFSDKIEYLFLDGVLQHFKESEDPNFPDNYFEAYRKKLEKNNNETLPQNEIDVKPIENENEKEFEIEKIKDRLKTLNLEQLDYVFEKIYGAKLNPNPDATPEYSQEQYVIDNILEQIEKLNIDFARVYEIINEAINKKDELEKTQSEEVQINNNIEITPTESTLESLPTTPDNLYKFPQSINNENFGETFNNFEIYFKTRDLNNEFELRNFLNAANSLFNYIEAVIKVSSKKNKSYLPKDLKKQYDENLKFLIECIHFLEKDINNLNTNSDKNEKELSPEESRVKLISEIGDYKDYKPKFGEFKNNIEDIKNLTLEELNILYQNAFFFVDYIEENISKFDNRQQISIKKDFDKLVNEYLNLIKDYIDNFDENQKKKFSENFSYRDNLNKAKAKKEGISEESLQFASLEKLQEMIKANPELEKQFDDFLEIILKQSKDFKENELKDIIESIAKSTGLSVEDVNEVYENQQILIESKAKSELYNESKKLSDIPILGKIPLIKNMTQTVALKTVLYIGAAIGVGAIGLPTIALYGALGIVGGARILDNILTDKATKKKQDKRVEEIKQNHSMDDLLARNLLASTTLKKRLQIQNIDLGNANIEGVEENIYLYLREVYPNKSEEEIGNLVESMSILYQIDQNNQRLENKINKKSSFQKLLENETFKKIYTLGGILKPNQNIQERNLTTGIVCTLGIVARELPVLREVLGAYTGYRLGEFAGNLLIKEKGIEISIDELYEILKKEKFNEEDKEKFALAKVKINEKGFKENNPKAYLGFKDLIDKYEELEIKGLNDKGSENITHLIESLNDNFENQISKRKNINTWKKIAKTGLKVGGAFAGFWFGHNMAEIQRDTKLNAELIKDINTKTLSDEEIDNIINNGNPKVIEALIRSDENLTGHVQQILEDNPKIVNDQNLLMELYNSTSDNREQEYVSSILIKSSVDTTNVDTQVDSLKTDVQSDSTETENIITKSTAPVGTSTNVSANEEIGNFIKGTDLDKEEIVKLYQSMKSGADKEMIHKALENAKNIEHVDKGEYISGILNKNVTEADKIIVINPDGSIMKGADINTIIHPGDTLIHTNSGEMIIMKTSEITVDENDTLGNIILHNTEKTLGKHLTPEQMKHFDTNGDGKINWTEAKNLENELIHKTPRGGTTAHEDIKTSDTDLGESGLTEMQKFQRDVAQLNKDHDSGKINQTDFEKQLHEYQDKIRDLKGSGTGNAEAVNDFTDQASQSTGQTGTTVVEQMAHNTNQNSGTADKILEESAKSTQDNVIGIKEELINKSQVGGDKTEIPLEKINDFDDSGDKTEISLDRVSDSDDGSGSEILTPKQISTQNQNQNIATELSKQETDLGTVDREVVLKGFEISGNEDIKNRIIEKISHAEDRGDMINIDKSAGFEIQDKEITKLVYVGLDDDGDKVFEFQSDGKKIGEAVFDIKESQDRITLNLEEVNPYEDLATNTPQYNPESFYSHNDAISWDNIQKISPKLDDLKPGDNLTDINLQLESGKVLHDLEFLGENDGKYIFDSNLDKSEHIIFELKTGNGGDIKEIVVAKPNESDINFLNKSIR